MTLVLNGVKGRDQTAANLTWRVDREVQFHVLVGEEGSWGRELPPEVPECLL
jgi:hypothetical protein